MYSSKQAAGAHGGKDGRQCAAVMTIRSCPPMELRLLTTKPRPSPTAAAAWPLAAHVLALVALFRLALERHVRPVNGAHAFRERAPKSGSWDPLSAVG